MSEQNQDSLVNRILELRMGKYEDPEITFLLGDVDSEYFYNSSDLVSEGEHVIRRLLRESYN